MTGPFDSIYNKPPDFFYNSVFTTPTVSSKRILTKNSVEFFLRSRLINTHGVPLRSITGYVRNEQRSISTTTGIPEI